ncbi:hypothetical protein BDZ45DRAFT_745032 [Acephala macrosclerotiorum]|nr:hypothetical protein BDZ45DRAFT_745032 [Acephala macrosclerotiorum]
MSGMATVFLLHDELPPSALRLKLHNTTHHTLISEDREIVAGVRKRCRLSTVSRKTQPLLNTDACALVRTSSFAAVSAGMLDRTILVESFPASGMGVKMVQFSCNCILELGADAGKTPAYLAWSTSAPPRPRRPRSPRRADRANSIHHPL